jgi:hypothetical protein
MRHSILTLALVLAGPLYVGYADEPLADDKTFEPPPPRLATTQVMPYYLPASLPRPGTREIWQYYGVDSRGRWLPRVILPPSGEAYYYYSGVPYSFTTPRPGLYMPYVVD